MTELPPQEAIAARLLKEIQAELSQESDRDEGQSKSSEDENAARDFLLSLAGTFNSGVSDTSENVKSLLAEAIAEKHPHLTTGS